MKRLRLLWWTYTVRGTDLAYVEVQSGFGLARVYSLGRWVLANLFGLTVGTVFVLVTFIQWIETGNPFLLVCEDDVCDSPRHWNRILRLVDDSGEVGQLAPKSPLGVQLVRWDSASFAFKAWIGFRTRGSTRRSAARYRLT